MVPLDKCFQPHLNHYALHLFESVNHHAPIEKIYALIGNPKDAVPEKTVLIPIRNYHQSYTLHPIDKGNVLVTFEGYIDPGRNIPSWLYNIFAAETPIRTIRSLRERVLSDKPALYER